MKKWSLLLSLAMVFTTIASAADVQDDPRRDIKNPAVPCNQQSGWGCGPVEVKAAVDSYAGLESNLKHASVKRSGGVIAITFSDQLLFDVGSAELRPGAAEEIATLSNALRDTKDKVRIYGHTDSNGEAAANQTLSEQRAKAVAAQLRNNNIADSRLTTKGFGATKPVASNDTPAGRQQNRRVEVLINK